MLADAILGVNFFASIAPNEFLTFDLAFITLFKSLPTVRPSIPTALLQFHVLYNTLVGAICLASSREAARSARCLVESRLVMKRISAPIEFLVLLSSFRQELIRYAFLDSSADVHSRLSLGAGRLREGPGWTRYPTLETGM